MGEGLPAIVASSGEAKASVFWWLVRALWAAAAFISVHIVSFYNALLPEYSRIIYFDLIGRITWDLFSTAVFAAYVAFTLSCVFWIIAIFVRTIFYMARKHDVPTSIPMPDSAKGGVGGVWALAFSTMYFGQPDTEARVFYFFIFVFIITIVAITFFIPWRSGKVLFKLTNPYRTIGVKVTVLVAASLFVAAKTGEALALRYIDTGVVTIVLENGSFTYSLLGMNGDGVLVANGEGKIFFIPSHSINSIALNPN